MRLVIQGRRIAAGAAMVLIMALAGCAGHAQVQVNDGSLLNPNSILAVLPLDESCAERDASDFAIYGRTGAQGTGVIIARAFSQSLSAAGFTVATREKMRIAVSDLKVPIATLGTISDEKAREIGRKAGADVIVRGCVVNCQTSWVILVPWSKVQFELHGVDVASGATLWTAQAGRTAVTKNELSLMEALAEKTARTLRATVPASP